MTILIQMVNFLIAYLIIRCIFLSPAVKVLTEEQEEQAQTMSTIEQLKNANIAKQDTMAYRWTTCQLTLQAHSPKVAQTERSMLVKETDASVSVPQPSPESIEPLVAQVAHQLTERLSNVR